MVTFISHSPEETLALGERWGREATDGWIVGLTGELGAGKTLLVKGLARGLGSPALVHSPTFALLNQYEGGRLPIFHIDLYRLSNSSEITAAGLAEYLLAPGGIVAVEWAEHWTGLNSPPSRKADLPELFGRWRLVWMRVLGETEREIIYEDIGH